MNQPAGGFEAGPTAWPPGAVDPDDYAALRHGVGARVLARDVLLVEGADAAPFLQGQCSQDLAALPEGAGAWTLVLEPDGKLCVLATAVRTGEQRYVLAVEEGFGEQLAARLIRFRLRTKVTIEEAAWGCVGLRGGEGAMAALMARTTDAWWGRSVVPVPARVGAWPGVDLLGPLGELPRPDGAGVELPQGIRWCGAPAWEARRVETGVPVMGRELDGRTIAQEAGLLEAAVSLTKGCYTGQELVARLDARGNRVARRLCGLVPLDPSGVAPSALDGAALVAPSDKQVGSVTSAAWCPGIGGTAGLGYVHRSVAAGQTVRAQDAARLVDVVVKDLPLVP